MDTIFSHLITLGIGIIIGALGMYIGDRLIKKANKRDYQKEIKKKSKDIYSKMPELINEMKEDLKNDSTKLIREFIILPSNNSGFNPSKMYFYYFENEHKSLKNKIDILEQNGFIINITETNTPKYRFDNDFVKLILKKE